MIYICEIMQFNKAIKSKLHQAYWCNYVDFTGMMTLFINALVIIIINNNNNDLNKHLIRIQYNIQWHLREIFDYFCCIQPFISIMWGQKEIFCWRKECWFSTTFFSSLLFLLCGIVFYNVDAETVINSPKALLSEKDFQRIFINSGKIRTISNFRRTSRQEENVRLIPNHYLSQV